MARIISFPKGLCFSENLPKFVLADVSEPQIVTLKKGDKIILEENYIPSNGKIEVNFSNIIREELSLTVPNLSTKKTAQSMGVADFSIVAVGETKTFTVLKGGVQDLSVEASEYCRQNFLTHQPQLKGIRPYQPEFVTYYATQSCKVVLRGYFTDKDPETRIYTLLIAGSLTTLNVSYSQITEAFSEPPSAVDVFVADSSGNRISIVQRYALVRDFYDVYSIYLFENTVGGFDTLVAKGERKRKSVSKFELASLDNMMHQYDIDVKFLIEQNIGVQHRLENALFDDFTMSANRWEFIDNALTPIYLKKVDENDSSEDDLSNRKFSYFYSKHKNIQKSQKVLNDLPLPKNLIPADDLFFLISESAQHVHYNLALLEALSFNNGYLLVNGEKIKSSIADATRDALLWAGHRFDDFIDQPVRSSDKVVHKGVSSESFLPGFSGAGYEIDENGNATFENLVVRKQMQIYELLMNKIRATNGAIWVSDSMKYEKDYGTNATMFRLGIDAKDSSRAIPFRKNDIILSQRWTGKGIRRSVLTVSKVDSSGKFVECLRSSLSGAVPQIGDEFVRIGNLTNQNRQGAIYITASDSNAPYLDVLDGVDSDDFTNKIKARLGKLSGIEDSDLGNLEGYGLYAQNAFLKGVFHVTGGNAETKEGSAALVQDLVNSLGSVAYVDKVEKAMLGDTLIVGGYLRNELIDVVNREKNFVLSDVIFSIKDEGATLSYTEGSIIHKGLGTSDLSWNIDTGNIPNLDTGVYNLYVKAPKNLGVARIVAAKTILALDSGSHYYIPLGELSSVNNGIRSINVLSGYTRIAPGEITTGRWKSPNSDDYIEFGDDGVEIFAKVTFRSNSPALDQVKNISNTDKLQALVEAKKQINQAKAESQQAWEAYAQAKANAAKTEAIANADGKITAEEQKRINADNEKLRLAKEYADAKDAEQQEIVKAYADGKVTASEQAMIAAASAKADLAEWRARAYADGKVTEAEQKAIDEAQRKYDDAVAKAKEMDDSLEIGGRNLLPKSKIDFTSKYKGFSTPHTNGKLHGAISMGGLFYFDNDKSNNMVRFSLFATTDADNYNNGDRSVYFISYFFRNLQGGKWHHLFKTAKYNLAENHTRFSGWFCDDGVNDYPSEVKDLYINYGTKDLGYTPAPEDVQAEMTKRVNQAKVESQQAWEAYAQAKANAAKTEAIANADGKITAEEQNRINADNEKLRLAKEYADAKDAEQQEIVKAYADGKVTASEQVMIAAAEAKSNLAEQRAKAYADGKVTEAEQKAIDEAQRKYDDAVAKAKEMDDSLEIGGRNYVLNSDVRHSITRYVFFSFENDLQQLRGKDIVVSLDVDVEGVTRGRIGFESAVEFSDSTSQYLGVWAHPRGDVKERISRHIKIYDKQISKIIQRGVYVQCDGIKHEWARPALHFGTKATDWTPAPEDVQQEVDDKVNNIGKIGENLLKNPNFETLDNWQFSSSKSKHKDDNYTGEFGTAINIWSNCEMSQEMALSAGTYELSCNVRCYNASSTGKVRLKIGDKSKEFNVNGTYAKVALRTTLKENASIVSISAINGSDIMVAQSYLGRYNAIVSEIDKQIEAAREAITNDIDKIGRKTKFLSETFIDNKCVASGAMLVGNEDGANAGITGVDTGDDAIRFYAGSPYAGRNSAPFRVNQRGEMWATNAEVVGRVGADKGYLGGFYFGRGRIVAEINSGDDMSLSGDNYGEVGNTVPFHNSMEISNTEGRILIKKGTPLDFTTTTVSTDVVSLENEKVNSVKKAVMKPGEIVVIGQHSFYDTSYIGNWYPSVIEDKLQYTQQFLFTQGSSTIVRLPGKSTIDALTNNQDVTFLLHITMGIGTKGREVQLQGVTDGKLLNNDANPWYGGYGLKNLEAGDILVLRYHNGYYYIVSHRE